jgi:trk system potassium uptake protein TrkH
MFRKNPWIIFILSYLLVSIIGGVLLFLPFSHHGKISFIDALFTSTSALSDTGLTVLDTGKDFTRAGQIIILFLLQIGGLGIMTFVVATTIFLRRRLGIGIKEILGEEYGGGLGNPKEILIAVCLWTFSLEFIGFLILLLSLKGENIDSKIFVSLFHSISAFCNAGFSTFSNNLEGFRNNYLFLLCIAFLIFCGSIGFTNGIQIFKKLIKKERKLTLNAKLVLAVSAILILIGTIIIFTGEIGKWKGGIFSLFVNSLFHAITPRTAGFNSLKIQEMHRVSSFFIWILMIIGASSGSCGGGIKTNTIGAIFSYIKGRMSGFKNASAFGRTINEETVEKAISVFAFYLTVLLTGTILLLFTEAENQNITGKEIFPLLFEATSALGTVGLSFGVTPHLSIAGKIVIMFLMLAGKIGLYSFIFAFLMRKREERFYTFPEEDIMVG